MFEKIKSHLPALAVLGSALAVGAHAEGETTSGVSAAIGNVSTELGNVTTALGGVQTAVTALAVAIAVIVIARAIIKKFLKI